MIRVTTDFLDRACANVPEKIGFEDKERTATYKEVRDTSLKIALALDKVSHRGAEPQPVAILSDTNIDGMAMIHGVLYSGNYYAAIDTKSPADRIINTLKQMEPVAIVTSASDKALVESLNWPCATVVLEECTELPSEEQVGAWINNIQPTDTSCVIFTSGSTGIPKGVEYDHRGVIGIMEAMCLDLDINSEDVVGNQSPIYYGMSTMNIFNSICAQAKLVLIPKVLFATPVPLLEYIIEKQISYVMWVPNIFATIAQFKAWEGLEEGLKCLKKLLFAGEVMPTKQINKWRQALPHIRYFHGYGSTEYFDSVFYELARPIKDDEMLPLGHPFTGAESYILKEDGSDAAKGEKGELCIGGIGLSKGYYKDPENTALKYREHPRIPGKRIFHSGDVVCINEYGEINFMNRVDFQIKHMGYRIELGEIEVAVAAVDSAISCACIYDSENKRIILVYQGDKEPSELKKLLKSKLPEYMLPRKFEKMDSLPLNPNRKIDRLKLMQIFCGK